MPRFFIILLLAAYLMLSGCATTYNPATGQEEFIFISTATEVSMGNMLAGKISKQFEFSEDTQKIDRLKGVGEKLASVSDRKDLKYRFTVIEEESLNAFTTPGGYIYINSGLIEKATDDELACVVGHEIGHVAARHIAKKLQAKMGYDILMNIAVRKGGGRGLQKAASLSYDLVMLGYSREDEFLADRLGVKYAYKAGYDPYAMITFLEKMKKAKGKEIGFVFLRSHPYTSERIKMMEAQIPLVVDKVDKGGVREEAALQARPASAPVSENKKRPLRATCPECGRIFSGKLRHCPYDGTEL